MRKSMWLLSAGLFALSTPAYAQDRHRRHGRAADRRRDRRGRRGRPGATRPRAGRHQRHRRHRDPPQRGAVRRAAGGLRGHRGNAREFRRQRHPPAQPGRAVAAGLLDLVRSRRGVARIRGIGTVGDNPGLESSVGVFIDGVYRSRTGVGLTELGAVERIEVLRGPQGTLFGRNASAGLISIITAKPQLRDRCRRPGRRRQLQPSPRSSVGVTGADQRHDRGAARRRLLKRDGFLEDVISGRDVNDRDRWLLRGQLLFEPTTICSFRLIGDYAKRDEECCAAPYLPARDYHRRRGDAAVDDRRDRARRSARSSTTTRSTATSRSRRAAAIARTSRTTACRARSSTTSAAPS